MQLLSLRYFLFTLLFFLSQLLYAQTQQIELSGNGNPIVNNSTATNAGNDTDFGSVALGANDVHTFTITNTGGTSLTVSNIVIGGAHPGDFTLGVTTFPLVISGSGGTATFTVNFAPIASNSRSAIVTVFSDDPDPLRATYNFAVEGNSPPNSCFPTINSEDADGNSTTVICNNSPLTLTPSVTLLDCPTCSYQWSDGTTGPFAFAFAAGTYQVTVTDNFTGGCVGISPLVQITSTNLATPLIQGDSFYICDPVGPDPAPPILITVTNPCAGCSYQWYKHDSYLAPDSLMTGETNSVLSTLIPGEYYVEATSSGASSCSESSEVIIVKEATVTKPFLLPSTTSICDSNTSVLTTIDCNGCNYEWHYYDYEEEGKLVITGVFNGTRPNGGPNGIELYAIGNIPDLSLYSLTTSFDGPMALGGTVSTFTFPAVALAGGTYIYVTDDEDEFAAFFGFPSDYEDLSFNIDGNDEIEVFYNDAGTPVLADVFGDVNDITVLNGTSGIWDYDNGWAYRKPNINPSDNFTDTDWNYGQNNFNVDRNNAFWGVGVNAMPIGTYITPITPNNGLIISAVFADTVGGNKGRGVEFYAANYIPDLSVYSVKTVLDGRGQVATVPTYTFPTTSVNAGTYIYLTDDMARLNAFFPSLGGIQEVSSIIDSIDGDDAILLFQNGTNLVDVFGDTTYTGAINWNYRLGWAISDDNRTFSPNFVENDWGFSPNAWTNCPTNVSGSCLTLPALELKVGTAEFETHAASLILSGVFDGNRPGDPRGIELYAIDDIPNLNVFTINVYTAGGSSTVPAFTYTFPNSPVNTPLGTRIHLTSDALEFGNLFGIPVGSSIAGFSILDGNDAIELVFNGEVVDAIGDKSITSSIGAGDFSVPWAFEDGWLYRFNNTFPNQGDFVPSNWILNNHGYRPTNDAFVPTSEEIEIQTYVNGALGSVLNVIQGQDSFIYQTGTTGDYTIQVEYPNGCTAESDLVTISTSTFSPEIEALIPSTVTSSFTGNVSRDTTFLCAGSTVEMYMVGTYELPPTWSYQWSINGVDISGAVGYNYSATNPGLFRVQVINEDGCIAFSNTIVVINSTEGSNPSISASSLYLCSSNVTSTLTTSACVGCSYQWRTQADQTPNGTTTNRTYEVQGSDAGGYFVRVSYGGSGCVYESSIILVRDTTYAAPVITTNGTTVCSSTPIDLVTTPCAGCDYIWKVDSSGTFISRDTTQQFTYQIDTSGKYRLEVLYPDGCQTSFSNTIQATFQTVNASIATPPLTSVCNGDPVTISALPDLVACPSCDYQFLRDSVRMQVTAPEDQQEISLEGDYQVVVTNEDGCSDTSTIVRFDEVTIATEIRQSTKKICSPTSSMILEVDSCNGCAYQWSIGTSNLINSQDTFYIATGYGAVNGNYTYARVSKLGCVVIDSVLVDSVAERTIDIHVVSSSTVPLSPTMCDGSPVVLQEVDTCDYCQFQWFRGGDTIVGASFEAYQVDTPSTYYVSSIDTNNCTAVSNSITVQEFSPPVDFLLDFDTASVLPITFGNLSLDDYLYPVSLRSTGSYSSLTAGGAIIRTSPNIDSINTGAAGSGFHYIEYSYTTGNCTFSTEDTLEVLGAVTMDILNTKRSYLAIPASEACLFDTLLITVTNFTFIPNEVIFVAGGGNRISVPVSPSLTTFANVHSGSFTVVVPAGARTGKITLARGSDSFESPNFYLIQNPAVTINLLTGAQPICSNLDTAEFLGLPLGGSFSAHYLGMPTDSSLFIDSLLLLDSVTGYVSGIQNVMMHYTYTPVYTGTTIACRDSVVDSLLLEIRDVELDSVDYSAISRAQITEDLSNLTIVAHPISAQNYPNTYSGTYVLGSALLPSTIPDTINIDSITYQINNGGCINSSTDPIEILPAPGLLDSIPTFLCSKDDTVFIQRDVNHIWVVYRGDTIYNNTLYVHSQSPNITVGDVATLGVRYTEQLNLMEITTSNGGLDSIDFTAPDDEYYFVPANVINGATRLNIKFIYERTTTPFVNGSGGAAQVTTYTIAEISKNFIIEDPAIVAINPVILADTIFCPINNNNQFLGLPAGGQYYISGPGVGYDSLQNNIFNPTDPIYTTGNSYGLTYVYEGQACIDSAYTGIYLPDPFSIAVRPNNGTGEYCETSPNDSIFFDLLSPLPAPPTFGIDTSSAQFFINNIQSGTVFSPVQVGPPGIYNVRYVVADIYGCTEEATDVFVVSPIPNLAVSAIDPVYCLNDDTTQINLYQIDTSSNTNTLTTWSVPPGIGYIQNETVEFTGNGIIDGGTNPLMPYFYPRDAGVGVHDIRYVYADSNACMDSINFTIEVLPLPIVSMRTAANTAIEPFYCENDSISLIGFPVGNSLNSGYGSDTSVLYGNPDINSLYPSSLDSANKTFKPFVAGTQPGILREVLFYYYEDPQGCRDTARYSVTIRNFTTDPTIAGLPTAECANNLEIPVWADLNGGFDLDSLGWFTSDYPTGFSQIGPSPNTDSIQFYPDSMGIEFADRDVMLTFHYSDTSRNCFNSVSDTVLVRALPHLTLSEQLVTSLPAMDLPGSKMINPGTDTVYHHMCETAPRIPVYAYNTTGLYDPFTGNVTIGQSVHITPDTGTYITGRGIQSNGSTTNIAYGYIPANAVYGPDTIQYTYTDAAGCTDTIEHYMFVDTIPVLAFAGLSNYNSTINRYVYCETDPSPPRISATPSGVSGSSMTFNGQNISLVAPFNLRPDTLAVPGVYVDYPLQYNYIGQRYADGRVCESVLHDTVQIRPAPQLAWVNVPTTYCMLDTLERLPLSATPYGGQFVDATNNFQVIAGIVGDSLFNPSAQPGKRDIYYYYLDTVSGCDDTIQHTIYVYSKPRVSFDISGGCSGTQVDFIPQTAPYGLVNNGVAIDSITMVIWNFGDGVSDTLVGPDLPNTLGIPVDTHTYAGAGIFYPSITVVNQGICDTTYTRRIIISPREMPTDSTPYIENFDLQANGWMQESSDTTSVNGIVQDSLWQWGTITTGNFAGTTFWGTRFTPPNAIFRPEESAWVYSPCFDLTSLNRPMIKMSIWRNTRRGVDGAVLQYYDDVTNTWKVLGEHGKGINWYQDGYVVSAPGDQVTTPVGWSGSNVLWEDVRYRLDNIGNDLRNRTDVRFRMAFASARGTTPQAGSGFAFDSVRIGNRTRNVLTEHFSGLGYAGINQIEDQLYHTIFNNLYGRDVSLIQYHLNVWANDIYYNYNGMGVINDARKLWYGVGDVNRVRIDGKDLVSRTSDLLNYPQLEYLDIESLKDPLFKLEFIGTPAIQYGTGSLRATVRITALEDLPLRDYALHVVATEDSLTSSGHTRMAVLRDKHIDAKGKEYKQAWTAGESYDLIVSLPDINATNNVLSRIELVAFVQNMGDTASTKEVFQTISTRNITIYTGSVDTLDVSIDNIEEQPGYEVSTLKVYPNPTQELFNVAFETTLEADYEWQLIDVVGRVLKDGKVEAGTSLMQVTTDELSSGMYIFVVKNKNVYTQRKVIVQRY